MNPGLLMGSLYASMIAILSFHFRLLTTGGALAQWMLGTILLGVGGWQWTLPMLVFFVLSSLISRVEKSKRKEAESLFAKSSRRDAAQVLANGGLAGLVVIVGEMFQRDAWYIAYLGTVAAAAADTWGTEIGTLSRTKPRLLTTLMKVEAGRSGAISLWGTIAGISAASVVFLSATPWVQISYTTLVAVVGGGLVGMFTDSLFGATVQAQYRCADCGKITERTSHCGRTTVLMGGLLWFSNDMVNLLCTLAGGTTSYLLVAICGG